MKYDHRVKVDGKWFDAGVEIDSTPVNTEPPKSETPQNNDQDIPQTTNNEVPQTSNDEDENDAAPQTANSNDENDAAPKYTRTQIQQMNKETLIATAKELGLDFEEDNVTGNELKQMIMGKLGI